MAYKSSVTIFAILFSTVTSFAQTTSIQKAQAAYFAAQELEKTLNDKPAADRSRAEYLKVINAYERVYLITPQTGYADNALLTIARLYEEIREVPSAVKTLNFLIREYPQTPFKMVAEGDVARLQNNAGTRTPAAIAAVDNLRYWEAANSVRVVVDVSGEITFKQGEAKDPDRVFIDVAPARLNPALVGKQWPVKSGLLQQIRVGQFDNTTVRVVLDLGTIGRVTSFTLRDPDRLVIDILGQGQSIAATAATVEAEAVEVAAATPPAPVLTPVAAARVAAAPVAAPPPPTPEPVTIVTPAKPTNNGDRSLIRSLGLKLSRVVIDAGHGGHDTGTIGPTGYTEKELVLDVSRRLKELIENEMGAEVVMTRSTDVFVPLEARTAIANQQEADLFISIHANASKTKTVRGVETFFLNLTSNPEAQEIAMRENAASQKAIHELQDVVRQIMLSDKVDESRELAGHIQKALAARKDAGTNRGVKQAPFVVLIGANMPSILAEIGFISNPQDEKSIKSPQYRQQIAESLFEGVRSYAETLSGVKTAQGKD